MRPLTELRRALHAIPELAFDVPKTRAHLQAWLQERGVETEQTGDALIARLGSGPALLLRAELDGLPLQEATGAPHAAPENHHACGHDGHMAMLAGALAQMADDPPCAITALFQPAEETGEGMAKVMQDVDLGEIRACFTIHNIPGEPLGTVITHDGPAAAASTGLRIHLDGATSHAAEPWAGRNPMHAMARLIEAFPAAPSRVLKFPDQSMVALVEAKAGGPRYGTSAGDALVGATLRAATDADLQQMMDHMKELAQALADADGLKVSFEEVEPFPASINDDEAVARVCRGAKAADLAVHDMAAPFAWSEDFGYALATWPGALIGLGSGEGQPSLHSPDYDFPDDLLDPGVRLWCAIAEAYA